MEWNGAKRGLRERYTKMLYISAHCPFPFGRDNLLDNQQFLCIDATPDLQLVTHYQSLPLSVCREFQRGNCARGETDCRFAHPADSTMIDTNDNTAFPPGALHPLPKRQALEKSNGASTVFNPSVLHYQQALTSAQLQQHTAFIPTAVWWHLVGFERYDKYSLKLITVLAV
ncbi:hypothetical protein CB1_060782104 [Camelus ferus]|nr:hypothetical protein CB1_060782104 [Camelus ferus]